MTRKIASAAPPAQPIHHHRTHKINKQLILKVLKVAAIALATIALLFLQAPLMIAGFILGMIFSDKTRKVITRIKDLWMRKPWEMVGITVLTTIVGGSVVYMAAAFITGAYLGMRAAETRKK
jgi:hypothetical protein